MKDLFTKLQTFLSIPRWQFITLLLFTFLIHAPLLIVREMENPDAGHIFPILNYLSFPFGYLKALVNLDTLDFQPIRDLTLYFDIFVYDQTGYTIGVLLNCIIWAGSCYQILRILESELEESPGWQHFFIVLCFSVYPIFYNTVNWGIARKHLLAFFFILVATRNLGDWKVGLKRPIAVIIPYTLSVLSLPIAVAWPFWVILRLGVKNIMATRPARYLVSALLGITLLIAGINWAYYKTSLTFLQIYPQKASQFDPLFMLANLGVQVKQMVFPYRLGFFYNFSGDIYGLVVLVVFLSLVFYFRRKEKNVWIWLLFGAIPLAVTLSTPHVYYDPYVIIPLTGCLFFFTTQFSGFLKKQVFLFVPLFIFWSYLTWQGNHVWGDLVRFYEASYATNPNCSNALLYGSRIYRSNRKLPDELFQFIQLNHCFRPEPFESMALTERKVSFESLMYYLEEDVDTDFRRKRLSELGKRSVYALLLYAAFLAKEDKPDEVESIMTDLNLMNGRNLRIVYDPAVLKVLPDYCEKNKLQGCLAFMKTWKKEVEEIPYF